MTTDGSPGLGRLEMRIAGERRNCAGTRAWRTVIWAKCYTLTSPYVACPIANLVVGHFWQCMQARKERAFCLVIHMRRYILIVV
jgi:hypothetical protein